MWLDGSKGDMKSFALSWCGWRELRKQPTDPGLLGKWLLVCVHASLIVDAGFMIPPQLWAAQLPAPKEVSIEQKNLLNGFAWNFQGRLANWPVNKWLNFGGDPDHSLDTGIVYRIRHYWEIRKVVNRHKSAAHTDSPDGGIGMHIGGGMHCPSASNYGRHM